MDIFLSDNTMTKLLVYSVKKQTNKKKTRDFALWSTIFSPTLIVTLCIFFLSFFFFYFHFLFSITPEPNREKTWSLPLRSLEAIQENRKLIKINCSEHYDRVEDKIETKCGGSLERKSPPDEPWRPSGASEQGWDLRWRCRGRRECGLSRPWKKLSMA